MSCLLGTMECEHAKIQDSFLARKQSISAYMLLQFQLYSIAAELFRFYHYDNALQNTTLMLQFPLNNLIVQSSDLLCMLQQNK